MRLWRKRYLQVLILAASLNPVSVSALTLGNFAVHTRALEPFRGEVELYDVYGVDFSHVSIQVTKGPQATEAGLDADFWSSLDYGISTSNGLGWISVYSKKPLRVKSQVKVELTWPDGHIERIYKVGPIGLEIPKEKTPCRASGNFVYCR